MSSTDEFESALEGPYHATILEVCAALDLDPESSESLVAYFLRLIAEHETLASPEGFRIWLRERLRRDFRVLKGRRPSWIQNPEWPVSGENPMLFVGQVNIPAGTTYFGHNTASFYVFWSPETGERKVVLQYD